MCDPLSFVSHSSKAVASGRSTAIKLKEVLSRQQFEIVLQAKVGQKVISILDDTLCNDSWESLVEGRFTVVYNTFRIVVKGVRYF